jgi:hypothetical protein
VAVPTVCQFFGVSIRMYFDEHPPPHFHAYYGEFDASISIETLDVVEGRLPRRALTLVIEWAIAHRHELRENWALAQAHGRLRRIEPLE